MVGDRTEVEQHVDKIGLTPNQIAANGPLPGDVSLYAKELACQQKIATPGYYPSLNGAEISDSERSGIFPCATFLGSYDGPNVVYAWRSASDYPGIAYINNRKPGELYIIGGEVPSPGDPLPPGPYLAKADATTGKEIWRTYFDNASASGWYIGNTNLNILDNGKLALSWSNNALLVDGDTGLILKIAALPVGRGAARVFQLQAPDDRARPHADLQEPDPTHRLHRAGHAGNHQVHPGRHEDAELGAGRGRSRHARGAGQAAAARAGAVAIHHHEVPRQDRALRRHGREHPALLLGPGGEEAVGRRVLGNLSDPEGADRRHRADRDRRLDRAQLNGAGSKEVSSSIAAAHRDDAKRQHVIFPFGPMTPGGFSFAPPKAGADPENGMVYSADMGMGKVAGIKLDQATGEMKVAFVVDDVTSTFQPVIGPKDKRVLLLTNAKQNVAKEPLMAAIFTNNYKEQLTWRDAATGKILAESDFFEPLTINSLTPPGFGGRVYFPSTAGKGFYVLQAMPKPAAAK